MKYLLLMIDGGADRPDQHGRTPFSQSKLPHINALARKGQVGTLDLKYGSKVDSDVGFLTILGYDKLECSGRGYLEALGAGLSPGKNAICIRTNFATLGPDGMIADRRAGRDNTGLHELVNALDGVEIDGIAFRMVKSAGHRVVIVLEDPRLSTDIDSNDPRQTGVPLPQVQPTGPSGKFTASLLNKFSYRVNKVLSEHPINKKRKFPANTFMIRSVGKSIPVTTFHQRFNMKACCIAGIPIADGVARYLGMDIIKVPGATGYPDTDWDAKVDAAIKALQDYDFVWLHINACDILAHDKMREQKAGYMEKIDKGLGKILEKYPGITYIVTPDHATVSLENFKEYEHVSDPVPVLISGPGIKPNAVNSYNELAARKGFSLQKHSLMDYIILQGKKR